MRKILLTAALCLSPLPAFAESQADRLERLTLDMTGVMWELMAKEAELEGGDGAPIRAAIAKVEWTDALDTATACTLDRYNDQLGPAAVNDLFDRMETMIEDARGQTLDEFSTQMNPEDLLPAGLTEDESMAINEECGMADAQLEMMQQTGFMAAMMAAMADS